MLYQYKEKMKILSLISLMWFYGYMQSLWTQWSHAGFE